MSTATLDIAPERWGPSDQDRDAWLAFRRTGLTATEIRDLYTGKTRVADLVAEKLGRRSTSFGGNRYTAWGTEREPVIAAVIEERYAIAPESRALRDAADPRRLASPDGVGRYGLGDDICISEVKTAGEPIPYRSPAFEAKGYLAQIVWGMLRAGAIACLYAWELRLDDGANWFTPGALTCEWILLADHMDLVADLEGIADKFFEAYAAAASEPWSEPEIDEDLDTLAVNVLAARVKESEGKTAKEAAWSSMLDRLAERGEDFQQESMLARITFTAATESKAERVVPDIEAALENGKGLWQMHVDAQAAWESHLANFTKTETVTTTTKASLTVTAVKKPKEQG